MLLLSFQPASQPEFEIRFPRLRRGSNLAGRAGCRFAERVVGDSPDTVDASTRTDEQCRRGQRHEREKQCVFDQVLALLVSEKILQNGHCVYTPFSCEFSVILGSRPAAFVILGSRSFPPDRAVETCSDSGARSRTAVNTMAMLSS